jgi:IS4 transposase
MEREKTTNVEELMARLPKGYEEASGETGALKRRREIKSGYDLIRLVLIYLTGGYSQLEMSVISKSMGIAEISDVGLMKRFSKCGKWLEWILQKLSPKAIVEYKSPKELENYEIVAIDASDVSEKGRSKRIFRLHYALNLMKMCAASYKITSQKTGESLQNFDIKKGWLILADRIYGTLTGIEHCLKQNANFILRLRWNAFKLYTKAGDEINLLKILTEATSEKAINIEAYVTLPAQGKTKLRICASRIPDDKLTGVEIRNKKKAIKKQKTPSDEALIMSNYVVVITALPDEISADEITRLYRLRWQVELYFKRLKSILDFGNIPLKKEESIFTWLNGKLLVSLLIEQMLSEISFSP